MTNSTHAVRHCADRATEVLTYLPGDVTAAIVAVLLDASPGATNGMLATAIGNDAGTVRRAVKRLVDAGLVVRKTARERAAARTNARAPTRGGARVRAVDDGAHVLISNSLFPTGTRDDATDAPNPSVVAARSVWDAKHPKPAQPFVSVVKIIGRLLDAGWSADDVIAACVASPTITVGWVESWLNKNRKPNVAPANDAARRDGPTRKVTL